MGSRACPVPAVLVAAWTCALLPLASIAQGADGPTISILWDQVGGNVSPLIFGAGYRRSTDPMAGVNPDTTFTYPATVAQIKDAGISVIRYPAANLANTLQWQRAIGPQLRRGAQISGLASDSMPVDSRFGPDEFGDLLEQSEAVGHLVVNFGTGSAADAADFVAYMASPIGSALVNGVDWAIRRAANHHPTAYKITHVDIGNELDPTAGVLADQFYWMQGAPTSINSACAADKISCLYAFGGSTRFEKQLAVQPEDWRDATSQSSGEPDQAFYVRYAPVAAGSETVWIDGSAWQGLSDLASAASDARVYTINYPSGAIRFGDGVHGAIPPKGSRVSLTYTSGPHEGFVDYYRAIKAVNSHIRVCAAIHDESFLRIMGAQHPYDCIQQHPHVSADSHGPGGNVDEFFMHTANQAMVLGEDVRHTQQLVKKYAGGNAGRVEMVLNEYGQLGTPPGFAANFARSQGEAVLDALYLREWVLSGVAAATRSSLTDYSFKPLPAALPAVPFRAVESGADSSLFSGPGPDTIVTPSALAMKLLRRHTGTTLVATTVTNNPKVGSPGGGALDALQVYSTRDSLGNVNVLVINVDPQHDVRAAVALGDAPHGQTATLTTLASSNLTDENTSASPTRVGIAEHTLNIGPGGFEVSFPKHSVTSVRLTIPIPVTEASPPLAGTEWRMLEFRGGAGGLLVVPPAQRSRYIVQFNADHSVVTRMDCNRGRGTWESKEPPQLSLGTLALTRAMCPPGSLGAEFVKLWPLVHSYVIRDGHLNLSLLADGGVFDLEPSNTQDDQ